MKRPWTAMLLAACAAALLFVSAGAENAKVDDKSPPKASPEDQKVHDELIALRDRAMKAYNARDLPGLLENVHENVVVTWQNGDVSRGHKGVTDFYKKTMEGPDSEVKDLKSTLTVDELSILYCDRRAAVAFGSLEDDFTLRDGSQFHLNSRWTATLVKEDDKWTIAAFHVSTNMFDNGVLWMIVSKYRNWSVGVGVGVGVLLGLTAGFLMFRRRAT